MMMSEAKAQELNLPVLARIRAFASVGVDPALMGIAPVYATRRCLERVGWQLAMLILSKLMKPSPRRHYPLGKCWSGMNGG
jgi:acetyl-CoA acetyltransferase